MRKKQIKDLVAQAKRGEPEILSPVSATREVAGRIKLVPVKQHLLTIQEYDPIGFLGKIMSGELIETQNVRQDEDGNVIVEKGFLVPNVKHRVEAAKFLASKLLPTMHAHKIMPEAGEEDKRIDEKDFDKLVEHAIVKSSQSH